LTLSLRRATTCKLFPFAISIKYPRLTLHLSANQQATQLRDLAAEQTGNASKTLQGYTSQYTAKAQETINQYRGRSASSEVKREDFPNAPQEPVGVTTKEPIAPKPVAEPNFAQPAFAEPAL